MENNNTNENTNQDSNITKGKMSSKKIVIVSLATVALLLVAGLLYNSFFAAGGKGLKEVTVNVINLDGAENSYTYKTEYEFLGELLIDKGLAKGSESEYGLFMTEVDGIVADDAKQQWWCITKSGESVATGADTTPISDGDIYELTLIEGY